MIPPLDIDTQEIIALQDHLTQTLILLHLALRTLVVHPGKPPTVHT
jgi:hypothetical protein